MSDIMKEKVAIIGSGLIGRSWSMLFAGAGYHVMLYDIEQDQVTNALKEVKVQLSELEAAGILRGTLSAEQQGQLITGTNSLAECVKDAAYVQECVPEREELKRLAWTDIDQHVTSGGGGKQEVILASSTSAMDPQIFSHKLKHRNRIVVTHPVNPPYYVPLVEVLGAPYTDVDVVPRAVKILESLGQVPVVLKKYKPGFVLNRMQFALLNECWRLVQEDVMSSDDVDKVMHAGLARRYAFMGPFETIHLNAEGTASYFERYGSMIEAVSADSGAIPEYSKPETSGVHRVEKMTCEKVPLDKLAERRKWRDGRLIALSKLINEEKQ